MVYTSFHEILVCTRYVPLINSQEHKVHHPPCTVIIYHHLYIYITTKEIHTPRRSRTIAKGYKLPYLSREVKLAVVDDAETTAVTPQQGDWSS